MCIPADAANVENAHLFLDHMMRPEVAAACTNYTGYANGNAASVPLLDPEIASNPAVYPDAEMRKRMYVTKAPDRPNLGRAASTSITGPIISAKRR